MFGTATRSYRGHVMASAAAGRRARLRGGADPDQRVEQATERGADPQVHGRAAAIGVPAGAVASLIERPDPLRAAPTAAGRRANGGRAGKPDGAAEVARVSHGMGRT